MKELPSRGINKGGHSTDMPSIVHEALTSPGQPLDAGTRAHMEPRFGHDFSRVRIHADTNAAESARSINALAYTVDNDVVFNRGRYAPGTLEGRQLLGHELAHVVQQTYGKPPQSMRNAPLAASNTMGAASQLQRQVSPTLCSTDKFLSINADCYRARGMLLIASGKLAAYSASLGYWPSSVGTAMNRHFGTTLPPFAAVLSMAATGLAALTQALSLSTDYVCVSTGSYPCSSNTLAWVPWCVPGMPIVLCDPNYFSQTELERSTTLIHEWTHKFWCRLDIGYEHEPGYPQNLFTASVNADNFANLVRDIQ